ncbi:MULTISPECIES: nitroreductase family deazaflavin-dependent oxidoreductase [unclassified Isoptericola]|uniref:nitroreductase family deazaflavin-dependent oxidoreductase n=1 Tax=unclassified Isoptericola TaxID=2623355 RepID=UPI0036625F00
MTDATSPRTFRRSRARDAGDAVTGVFVRLGLVPSTWLLTTRGRRSGLPRTHPATLVDLDGRRWLVAPYGVVSWVHNVRADPRVLLRRGLARQVCVVRAASAEEAGPVLRQYLRLSRPTRPYFAATLDSPVADLVAEADRHPVFELLPYDAVG